MYIRQKLANFIYYIHLMIVIYNSCGWMLNDIIHHKIIVFLIPCIYFQWYLCNNKCILTIMEDYIRGVKRSNNDGFVDSIIRKVCCCYSSKFVNYITVMISMNSFIISYIKIIS